MNDGRIAYTTITTHDLYFRSGGFEGCLCPFCLCIFCAAFLLGPPFTPYGLNVSMFFIHFLLPHLVVFFPSFYCLFFIFFNF